MTPLSQKAHDISFAVFRVATLVQNTKLRRELEDAATDLVARYEDAANPSITYHVVDPIDRLDRLVAVAESIKEMKPVNSQVLRRELRNLQTAMKIATGAKVEDIDVSNMFPLAGNTVPQEETDKFSSSNFQFSSKETENTTNGLTVRQEEILSIIRETQYCRLRNIMDKMPKVSERTIRNDIQTLISNELITRIGAGGPASYFQTMEVEVASTPNLPAKVR